MLIPYLLLLWWVLILIIFVILYFRTALETIEKLTQTLDFSDYASQIIHGIIQVSKAGGLDACIYVVF